MRLLRGFCTSCQQSRTTTVQTRQIKDRRFFSRSPRIRADKETIRRDSHYDFFPGTIPQGPPPQGPFHVDLKQLRKEFLQMQATAHPDRHPGELKGRAEALSARINEAYKTLQDPLRRTQYILSLRGIDVAEDETAKVDDPTLLMEVLEARETIEEAEKETDLDAIRAENDSNLKDSIRKIEEAFKKDDLHTAKEEAVKLRYWTNIKESIDDWEPGKPVVLIH